MTKRTWRGFGTAVALLAAALIVGGALAPPPAAAQKTVTLKMQATWPAGWTLYDNFTQFAERVNKLSGGRLKIETLPAGAIVPAFEVLDAVHKKVLDGGHSWAAYWVGKNKTAVLFTGGPGGTFGMDYIDAMGAAGSTSTTSSTATSSRSTWWPSPSCRPARRPSAGSSGPSRTWPTSRA
ncbi:MAG: hypothetical protein HYU42_04195 [Candidatus Rokubacteria bacterium]|nr:hypothetical protein [Candidatus Rokubacteria bacterium]